MTFPRKAATNPILRALKAERRGAEDTTLLLVGGAMVMLGAILPWVMIGSNKEGQER